MLFKLFLHPYGCLVGFLIFCDTIPFISLIRDIGKIHIHSIGIQQNINISLFGLGFFHG